jgi:hypothetical protein
LQITHGLLRNPATAHHSADKRIADALHADPSRAILVSASSPDSLSNLARLIAK